MLVTQAKLGESVIEAAGGVVQRRISNEFFVAVIRRDRHGHEWALPKGKRVPGESWQETARREVLEETGLTTTILSLVGCTSYLAQGVPKIVVYWLMDLQVESEDFFANEETKELRWIRPHEAVKLLTHAEERQLLFSIYSILPEGQLRGLQFWRFPRLYRAKRLQRLSTTIRAYELELSGRAYQSSISLQDAEIIQAGLTTASNAARDGRLEEGWKCLLAAQRVELLCLSDEELLAAALALRHEATKLNAWRKAAVLELLIPADGVGITKAKVFRAALLRDEHYHNEAYKDALRRGNALMLALCLVLAIAGLLWQAKAGAFQSLEATWSDKSFGQGFIALIALVGILGANVSAITDLGQAQVSARIPEMVSTFRVTALRLFIGSASAIFLFLVARAGVVVEVANGYAMLVFAFAAGFSERLVLRVVRSIIDKGDRSS